MHGLDTQIPPTIADKYLAHCHGVLPLAGGMLVLVLRNKVPLNRPSLIGFDRMVLAGVTATALRLSPAGNEVALSIVRAWGYSG